MESLLQKKPGGSLHKSEWLLVSTGQSRWFLSCGLLHRLIPTPKIQEIPGGSRFTGLVELRNRIHLATTLSSLLGEPEEAEVSCRWGLLIHTQPESILLLVEGITGPVTFSSEEIFKREGDLVRFSAFLGMVSYRDKAYPLLNPLLLEQLRPPLRKERPLPLAIPRPTLSPVVAEVPSLLSLLLLEDGGQLYGFPAKCCFGVRRIRPYRSKAHVLRPSEIFPPLDERKEVGPAHFTCHLSTKRGTHVLAFERFVELLRIDSQELSQWTGLGHFSLLGAFLHGAQQQLVLVVDPEALSSEHLEEKATEGRRLFSEHVESEVTMSQTTTRYVLFGVGEWFAALPMEQLHFVTSQRRATVHPVSAKHPAMIGLQERDGHFLTLIDPALWLGLGATVKQGANRLLELRVGARAVSLLSASLSAPMEVLPEQLTEREFVEGTPFPQAIFPRQLTDASTGVVPVLDVEALLAELLGGCDV